MLVVIESFETAPALSFRNLPEVQLIKVGELNAYDVLCNDWIVFEQEHLPTADGPIKTEPDAYGKAEPLPDIEPDGPGAVRRRVARPAAADDSEPAGYPIKGNADSMLYHVPGSSHYERTIAEVWFATDRGRRRPPASASRRRKPRPPMTAPLPSTARRRRAQRARRMTSRSRPAR